MALTKQDLAAIKEIVQAEFVLAEKKFVTRDEFYKTADKILGELSTLRDEVTLSASHAQADDLEERTTALEDIHPKGKHPLPALA